MALSGIQIYKLLPQTNCKDCGFPTCLAFAMKLAAKQAELSACPHVSEESEEKLAASAQPPIRLVNLQSNGFEAKAGNEVVLFRHEKTFYHKPGLFIKIKDDENESSLKAKVSTVESYRVSYVGIDLFVDGFAIESVAGDAAKFAATIETVRGISKRPVILLSHDPEVMEAGLQVLEGETPLIYTATEDNWESMTELALRYKAALAVTAYTLDSLADISQKINDKGVKDIVIDHMGRGLSESLIHNTQIRRLALKKNFRPLGFPIIAFPGDPEDPTLDVVRATQAISKYAGFVVLDKFSPESIYALLVLRENIYTDPQKPIQVQPGIYEINDPTPDSPLLVTTNFSITYFSVANEVESAGLPSWLLVTDAEGMSVLTAWAAGKFDAERIAKDVKRFDVPDKIGKKQIILPGHVAVLSGELEEELPGWEVRVGPREAVDIPTFLKQAL
jgi:acetyl-CoA decarbonylase/synthase complex subunit gamma